MNGEIRCITLINQKISFLSMEIPEVAKIGITEKSRSGEIGRRAGLKIQWGQPRAGSSPAFGNFAVL